MALRRRTSQRRQAHILRKAVHSGPVQQSPKALTFEFLARALRPHRQVVADHVHRHVARRDRKQRRLHARLYHPPWHRLLPQGALREKRGVRERGREKRAGGMEGERTGREGGRERGGLTRSATHSATGKSTTSRAVTGRALRAPLASGQRTTPWAGCGGKARPPTLSTVNTKMRTSPRASGTTRRTR